MKSKSLLDLLPQDEREKAIERGKKRLERRKARKGLDVSPEIYEICEFGYYFDWEAIMAIRRGYTVVPKTDEDLDEDKRSGRKPEWTSMYKREFISMDEVQVMLEGARKVWYTKLIESAGTNMASTSAAFSKTPTQSLENQLQPLREKSEVKE